METEKPKVLRGDEIQKRKVNLGWEKSYILVGEQRRALGSTKLRLEDQSEQGILGKGSYFSVCGYVYVWELLSHNFMLDWHEIFVPV